MSGCDRELNAHIYSAASLTYHAPDTWHDTTPSHIILTLGRPVLALPRVRVPSKEQLVPFLTTLLCPSLGSNPWPPVPQSGHSTTWATGATTKCVGLQEAILLPYKTFILLCLSVILIIGNKNLITEFEINKLVCAFSSFKYNIFVCQNWLIKFL